MQPFWGPPSRDQKNHYGLPRWRSNRFRLTQLMVGWWGLLILGAGELNEITYSPSETNPWSMWLWYGMAVLGFAGSLFLAPQMLDSGMLFLWLGIVVSGFILNWAFIYLLKFKPVDIYLLLLWLLILGSGCIITGYFMDRRFFLVAGWYFLMAGTVLILALINGQLPDPIDEHENLFFGLLTGLPLLLAALPFWKETDNGL